MSVEFPDPKSFGEDVPDGSFGGTRATEGAWRLWTREEQAEHFATLDAALSSRQAALQAAHAREAA